MAIDDAAGRGPGTVRRQVRARLRAVGGALEHFAGGLATAVTALAVLVWLIVVALTCVIGVGLLLIPSALQMVRAVADRERTRLTRWGPRIIEPEPLPAGRRAALRDPAVRRELGWLAVHATFGLFIGIIGLTSPFSAAQDVTFPLWWHLMPPGSNGPGLAVWSVHDLTDALAATVVGVVWFAVIIVLSPAVARLQAWPGRSLLTPSAGTDLSLRVAQLTATRAAALDAHAVELRRIERSMHDGTQNRLVAVTMLIGAARRAVTRDPAGADAILGRAQDAAEQALAELRTVARGILPPVLADRGLAGALTGLAADCGVPCRIDVQVPGRCAASVEATAYFVVAEALTNIGKHSGATNATVTVGRERDRLILRVEDDGRGGADAGRGSGLTGIRRRVDAYDGLLTITSPPGGPTTMRVELPCG